ncbi:MAG: hypothetical protein NTY37_06040 [Methanothrix sp.]|nr:hypothetical protein [Methanothrix sp.]
MAMKRPGAICLMTALICVALAFAIPASGASDDYSALMKLIADNEDSRMNAMDLAFLLATHNFDATPEDGYVIVKLEGMIYSLSPNGEKPGLAEVTTISNAQKDIEKMRSG